MPSFAEMLDRHGPVIIDGGLATQCEAMGCDIDGHLWSAVLLQENPRAIVEAHRAYLDAGAEIIITASYQASRQGLMATGLTADQADELIALSVALAAQARTEFLRDNPDHNEMPLVAASIGPYGAMLNDGSEYTGRYDVSTDELRSFHRSRLALLDGSGADVFACETIPSFAEARVLCELLNDVRTPAWVSFSCGTDSCISDGTPIAEVATLFRDHQQVLAVGVNCTAPQLVEPLIRTIKRVVPGKAIVAYPNSGETFQVDDNSWSGTGTAELCAASAQEWIIAGAKLIGGCCRVGPEQIAAIAKISASNR